MEDSEEQWPGYLRYVVRVYPFTSKGVMARCYIEVPTSLVEQFTEALRAEARSRRKEA